MLLLLLLLLLSLLLLLLRAVEADSDVNWALEPDTDEDWLARWRNAVAIGVCPEEEFTRALAIRGATRAVAVVPPANVDSTLLLLLLLLLLWLLLWLLLCCYYYI